MSIDLKAIGNLSPETRAKLIAEADRMIAQRRLAFYKPYKKQAEFHRIGANIRERLLMASNQTGKTLCAAAETAMHLTGKYPEWWKGKRFDAAVQWMAASETGKLTRDGVQVHLCGWPIREKGTGMIPADDIIDTVAQQGVADAYDYVRVKHVSGGESICYFRSYDQGRERVQAMTLSGVWLDEEPDSDFYFECLTRTNTTTGPIYMTFTPLKGMSTIVSRFLNDKPPSTEVVTMTLEDAEHYTPEQRKSIIASYPEHEKMARAMGVPALGSGRIFPVNEDDLKIPAFQIPSYWTRICGMDFGWDHPTAAVWLAWDRDTDTVYVTDCYRKSEDTPIIHAAAINARGKWIPVAWPHDGLQHDKGSGVQLAKQYKNLGVKMLPNRAQFEDGSHGVEAGLMMMLDRMQTGRFKVFDHLNEWFEEYRMYHRKDGKVVKERDDLLSATRYACMDIRHARVQEKRVSTTSTFEALDPQMGY